MSTSPERPALPLIIVHAEAAAGARSRVSDLLEAAGARPEEVQHLLAVIEAGAVEGAHVEVAELDTAPAGSSEKFGGGWLGAVQAVASRLTHIADRTVRQARVAAAAPEPPPAVSSPTPRRSPTAVEAVAEEQVHRVLEAADTRPERPASPLRRCQAVGWLPKSMLWLYGHGTYACGN